MSRKRHSESEIINLLRRVEVLSSQGTDMATAIREIEQRITTHTKADETFNYTLSLLVQLTSRANECFARANIEQKRKLLTLIFANLEMQGTTLCYDLRKPFDLLVKLPESEEWRALQDSNL